MVKKVWVSGKVADDESASEAGRAENEEVNALGFGHGRESGGCQVDQIDTQYKYLNRGNIVFLHCMNYELPRAARAKRIDRNQAVDCWKAVKNHADDGWVAFGGGLQ